MKDAFFFTDPAAPVEEPNPSVLVETVAPATSRVAARQLQPKSCHRS